MRKFSVALLIALLAASCFAALSAQTIAQTSDTQVTPASSSPPLIIRWMRYQGAVTQWNGEAYKGKMTINAKTANFPVPGFKPFVTVDAFWSNQPQFPATKPTGGEFSFTHYRAHLINLLSIRKQSDLIVNVTGYWNVEKVQITTQFNENGEPINTVKEITPILVHAKGQLGITIDWKQFTITIDDVNVLQGVEISMRTTTNPINPFTTGTGATTTATDLHQVMRCFKAVPGLSNYNPDLDTNKDSKIDLADLTTVAANM